MSLKEEETESALDQYEAFYLKLFSSPENQIALQDLRRQFAQETLPDDQLPHLKQMIDQLIQQLAPLDKVETLSKDKSHRVLHVQARSLQALGPKSHLRLILGLDEKQPSALKTLLLKPLANENPTPIASWDDFSKALQEHAPQASFKVSRVDPQGQCTELAALNPELRLPIGSAFKLYVLYTLAEYVPTTQSLKWDTLLEVKEALKSVPSGDTQMLSEGEKVAVKALARKMIEISDNTATDLLIHALGPFSIEMTLEKLGNNDPRNKPFLSTRQAMILKFLSEKERQAYLALPQGKKVTWWESHREATLPSLKTLETWAFQGKPLAIDEIEWFASANDLCRLQADFLKQAKDMPSFSQALALTGLNDGGLFPEPRFWDQVYFKGGSEPGVLNLSYLLQKDNKFYSFIVTLADKDKPVHEIAVFEDVMQALRFLEGQVSKP